MMNPYPTEEQLTTIEKWDLMESNDKTHERLYGLIYYVKYLWFYPDRFRLGKLRKHRFFKDRKIRTLYMSTGGWSGNESIIGALQKNWIFWMMYWYKSQKGGHYWFEIPPKREK